MFEHMSEVLGPYIGSNVVALALVGLALYRPVWGRYALVLLFAAAGVLNAVLAIADPASYLGFADLAVWPWYRAFIEGPFAAHAAWMVAAIALGQLVVAGLLMLARPWHTLGAAGAIVFLLAIAPLGLGSAFPSTVVMAAAVVLAVAGRPTARRALPGRRARA